MERGNLRALHPASHMPFLPSSPFAASHCLTPPSFTFLSDSPFLYLSFTGMLYNKTEYIWISSVKGAFP